MANVYTCIFWSWYYSIPFPLHQEAKSAAATTVALAIEYLASKMELLSDPFQLAITAYALDQTGHPLKDQAFQRLKTMKRQGLTSA